MGFLRARNQAGVQVIAEFQDLAETVHSGRGKRAKLLHEVLGIKPA
jgi:hypothetical protein